MGVTKAYHPKIHHHSDVMAGRLGHLFHQQIVEKTELRRVVNARQVANLPVLDHTAKHRH